MPEKWGRRRVVAWADAEVALLRKRYSEDAIEKVALAASRKTPVTNVFIWGITAPAVDNKYSGTILSFRLKGMKFRVARSGAKGAISLMIGEQAMRYTDENGVTRRRRNPEDVRRNISQAMSTFLHALAVEGYFDLAACVCAHRGREALELQQIWLAHQLYTSRLQRVELGLASNTRPIFTRVGSVG